MLKMHYSDVNENADNARNKHFFLPVSRITSRCYTVARCIILVVALNFSCCPC